MGRGKVCNGRRSGRFYRYPSSIDGQLGYEGLLYSSPATAPSRVQAGKRTRWSPSSDHGFARIEPKSTPVADEGGNRAAAGGRQLAHERPAAWGLLRVGRQ